MKAIPDAFACMARYLMEDDEASAELWNKVLLAAKRNGLGNDEEAILPAAVESLRVLMRKMKSSQPAKSPAAYFYVVIDRKLKLLKVHF
ncbi:MULTISPECIES: hypothetical protein [Bacillus]|uniref:hypothetical protein n=1 Tax=Bacillus TaxID=1386 RepID=UPI000C75D84B|nr:MULTISPECIES: hypothetical protein [Bacillus]MCK6208051.1 hypothetical protein [Bacillus infantis]PLR74920.1 hypothetical protein CYJ37_04730 [Bacillus sp. UMB0728]